MESIMKVKDRVAALRAQMREHGVQAYIVPSIDPHQSEYVPECWQRRAWISGFTGSAGNVVITEKEAGLWTDGRYFTQAADELRGSGIKLFKMGEPGVPTVIEYLGQKLGDGDTVGADPQVISLSFARNIRKQLEPLGIKIDEIERNLVDMIWSDQPSIPRQPASNLAKQFTGETTASKLRRVRKEMKEKGTGALVLSLLDEIAWLFNIRGEDVAFNPVVISYAIVMADQAFLFIHPDKLSEAAVSKLGSGIVVRHYQAFADECRALSDRKVRVWADAGSASAWTTSLLSGCSLIEDRTPIGKMKAKKNETEIAGMKAAHVRDGVAMVRFLRWLETAVPTEHVTEISASDRLESFRAQGEHFRGPSFATISGYGPHGAIIHYSATEKTNAVLEPEGIYLLDSGGQYLDGTTDITRTLVLGRRATKEQKDRFTRVLKGVIALTEAAFPTGVAGVRLDTLARQALWDVGLNYGHGTGHGVGAYLGVHEGPQSIGSREGTGAALEPGNILTNEPGFYVEGAYGIRIENLILVVEDPKRSKNGATFLRFETITWCPIDTRLIEPRLLEPHEQKWLNTYHREVVRVLSPHLEKDERRWLRDRCTPV